MIRRIFYSPIGAALIPLLLWAIIFWLAYGCAQTTPGPEKHSNVVMPMQTVNQVTVISPESMEWLIKLSNEDFAKALKIFKVTGGTVMSMGAWGIKVQGIQADDTLTSEATSDASLDAQLTK